MMCSFVGGRRVAMWRMMPIFDAGSFSIHAAAVFIFCSRAGDIGGLYP